MKIRNGFVSNSSSTSFLVVLKNPSESKEVVIAENQQKFADYLGIDVVNDKEELDEYKKFLFNGKKKILTTVEIAYGDESEGDDVLDAIVNVLKAFGHNDVQIELISTENN